MAAPAHARRGGARAGDDRHTDRARDRARGLHRSIKAKLDKLLGDEKFASNLREGYFSVRNERYVVPVLATSRAAVMIQRMPNA